ncbi:unnamed protein product [Adineta steineri]|uniref:Uncharacterized protein n=1 Tax=Adineta steineri TaxID=433720 RepID=A0A818KYQ8_9BILA|nr:unnamed protein product [Adineta steineri]
MSNLPLQSAVIHNDDNDEEINSTNNKYSTVNSRITSPLIIKRQQNIETEIANNQAYDEIHDLQPKHSLIKKTNNDNSIQYNQSKRNNSHELMQGNYYDQTRFNLNHLSEPVLIDINVEDYKKTIAPVSTSKNNSNKTRSSSPPFGNTSESIQQGIAQSAGVLLELNKKHHHQKNSMKNNNKSHERTLKTDDNNKPRSISSSSSSSSDCSTSDSSTSNKHHENNDQTSIPYEKLLNDDDDEDGNNNDKEEEEELAEQPKKLITESTTLLNKNLSQTYGTQSTNERSKYLPNNGYNSHGSSITTKSSSDNSGSIRTNSGSDNDEESDEEPYTTNSTPLNDHHTTSSSKTINKSNDIRYSYSNEQTSYQSGRSYAIRSEQIGNNDEHHLQVPRLKQAPNDDQNRNNNNNNNNKLNSGTDHNILPYTSKWPLQQSSNNQTNTLLSSSHQNRNLIERQDQQQQQQQQNHSNLSRNNSRQHQTRTTKKRKQSQQQEIIRTELIPGHRGDRDVDELVMFIDGNTSKQRQNSSSLHSNDINKTKHNSLNNDSNSNKTTSRKKSRKSIKNLQQSLSSTTTNNENEISTEQSIQSENFIDKDNQTTHSSTVNLTDQSSEHTNIPKTNNSNNNDESHLNPIKINSTNTTNGKSSLPNWFEQTRNTSIENDDIDSYCLSPTITNNLNSEIISEPFVTVTHRRRLTKDRRQDNNSTLRSSRIPPPPSSSSSNINDKRRILPTSHNGIQRPIIRNHFSNNKPVNSSIPVEENTSKQNNNNNSTHSESISNQSSIQAEQSSSSTVVNPINDHSIEKQQLSPRLSSHSSSSSLSSLIKRQSKPPPVVFLNKSIDIELNDVSFGFDLDTTTLNKSSDEINDNNNNNNKSLTNENDLESINPSVESIPSTDTITEKTTRKFQQRNNNRGPQFYSGSDIRPHQHRNYQPQSPYNIDPLLLLQYNQRVANYSQQLAYMNLLRTQYMTQQSSYVYLSNAYTTAPTAATVPPPPTTTNETDADDETNQTSSEPIPEPLLVYATPTGQYYFQPASTKNDSEHQHQQQQQQATPMPTVYTTTPTMYPSHYFYPPQAQHLLTSHPAYFQPIPSTSLLINTKSEQNDIDDVIINDDDYEKSTKLYLSTRQQSSSDIMSNALQLVYSQQKRNAQTDRFNLDDLTAYLAMKWTDTVDHYEQGDNRILLVDEQS